MLNIPGISTMVVYLNGWGKAYDIGHLLFQSTPKGPSIRVYSFNSMIFPVRSNEPETKPVDTGFGLTG